MYKQYKDLITNQAVEKAIIRTSDGACIPFDPANSDYQQFKKDLENGASIKDADGNEMTAEQITTFLGTLA
jgi:hypothetical protein